MKLDIIFSAKNASSNVSAVLFDLWERNRVELATRQNVLEIQILEDEQYKRMVEGTQAYQ